MDASPAQESNRTRKSSSPKQNILEEARKLSESACSESSEQKRHSENGQHEPAEISPVLSNCIVTEQSELPPEDVGDTILGLPPADVTKNSLTEHLGLPPEDAIKNDGTEQLGLFPEVVTKSSIIEKLGQSEPPPENVARYSGLDQSGSAPKDLANKRTAKLVKRKYKLRSSVSGSRVLRSRSQEKPKASQPSDNFVNASASRERKGRKKKRMNKTTADEFARIRKHLRYLLNRMSYEQNLIDAYSAEGWKGQSVEKLKPEKELQRASSEISRRKLKIRDLFQHLDSLCAEGRFPESLFDSEGQIDSEDIFCAKCESKDMSADNDIILCDGACDRGFHQFCLEPPLLKEEIPPDDEGWLCPACDCKVDCMDLLNDSQGTKLSVIDSWEKVFPEAAAAGNNQDNNSGFSSDDSEDNDYDPYCPEVDEKGQGDKSSSDKFDESDEFDEFDESDESDFTSASDDMVVSPNNEQCLGLPSDDSEDDDYDPDAPEIDEQVNQGSSSSDFTSDSEDFTATLDRRNFSDNEDGLDEQRRFGRKKKDTLKDELLSVLESNSGQDNAPLSAKRHVDRLDYKKLHDEAYGNVSSDSSDDEDWTENVIPRKRKNLSSNVASLSPNGNTSITENGTNTKDIKHDLEAAGRTPKRRTRQKLNLESTNNSLAESHKGSRSPGSTGEKSRQSSYKILGEAVTEEAYGNVSSDSSDDEDWTENVIPRKRKNLSGNVASVSPNGNTSITENGTDTKDIKHDLEAAGCTPKRRTRQKLNFESTNNSLAESHKDSRSPGSTGEKSGQSSYKKLGEAVTERLYKSFQENQYPDRAMKEKLAEELGITSRQVSKWFENARWSFRHRPPKEASAGKSAVKKDASTSQTDQKPEQEVVLKESSHNGVGKKESPKAGASKVDRSKEANAGKSAVKKDASTSQTDQKPEQEVVIKESSHNGVGKKESAKAGASKVDRCSGAKRRRKLATDGSHRQKSSTPNSTRQKTKSNHEASEATNGSSRQNSSTPKSRRQKTKLAGEASEATGGSSRQNSSTPNSKRRKTKSDHEASNPVLSGKKIAKTAKSSSGTPKTKEKLSDRIQTRSRKSIA